MASSNFRPNRFSGEDARLPIELGEIETQILGVDDIEQCAVIMREDTPGDQRLVAYFVGSAAAENLRQELEQALPDYMVPAAFVALEQLPVTANGKLDRRRPTAPDWRALNSTEFVAPARRLRRRLLKFGKTY